MIDNINIHSDYYPANFRHELQANLDYFLDGVGVSESVKVPFDHIEIRSGEITYADYANITAVGLYLNLLVEMQRAGNMTALERLETVIERLENAPRWHGLFHWLYTLDGESLSTPLHGIVSAVDNGNVAFSLAAVCGAYQDSTDPRLQKLVLRVERLLEEQIAGWSRLYDEQKGLLRAGRNTSNNEFLTYHIDRKANESRLAAIMAVLLTRETASAIPAKAFTDMELVTGTYNNSGETLEPILAWDGSYFQPLLPALWLDESQLIPDYRMFRDFTEVHKQFADSNQIPFLSAASTVTNDYAAFGLNAVSESYCRYGNPIKQSPTGSPHTLALYRLIDPIDAIDRLLALKDKYPEIETHAGWRDAVNAEGEMADKIIGLDQGMFVGAFFADSMRNDVDKYLESKGHKPLLQQLYQSFVADQRLPSSN